MKTKILNALKQEYKNLGLGEEAFERVATFGETFITSDEQIDSFVKAAEPLLKAEQSAADKVRTELNNKIKELEGNNAELEAKLKDTTGKTEEPLKTEESKPLDNTVDVASLVSKAIAEAIKPLQDDLSAFKSNQQQKSVVAALDELKSTWDYAKGYPAECEDAYERTMELYEVGGKVWSADELTAKFKEKFNKAVAKKGVDTTKPFKSDENKNTPDFSGEVELLKSAGVDLPE